jgi:glycosyltransferase involved in cell wall biosynthesis
MRIIQCSVVKNACHPAFDGGIGTLFTGTSDVVDGYVVAVDNSSDDGTYDAAERALKGMGKDFVIYGFDWPGDCSEAFNAAFDRADGLGADWYLRLDDDCRFKDVDGLREYVSECVREVVRLPELRASDKESIACYPETVIRKGNRYEGIIVETIEHPHVLPLGKYRIGPFVLLDHGTDDTENWGVMRKRQQTSLESDRLYSLIGGADTQEKTMRIANRFFQLSSYLSNARHEEWGAMAMALYSSLAGQGFEPATCYKRMSIISLNNNEDVGRAVEFMLKSKEADPEEFKRQREDMFGSVNAEILGKNVAIDMLAKVFSEIVE